MGAITNLIRTAGDFFNSTEEEQFMPSRKGIIYKKNLNKDWNPYEQEELRLQSSHSPYKYDDESEDEEDAVNELERFFIAKGKNIRRRPRLSVIDIDDDYPKATHTQAHVSYMIDDDGCVVKM
jgi:hypothetical protein